MNQILFCDKHGVYTVYLPFSNNYQCIKFNNEKMREYRKKNPDKMREACRRSAAKKREWIKQDKIDNPEKYESEFSSKKICEKHETKKVIGCDGTLICRDCKIKSAKTYRSIGTNYKQNVLNQKLKKYNLSHDRYWEMIKESNNTCFICGLSETRIFKGSICELSIDHCHKSEQEGILKPRGLLCFRCNTSLGGFQDNIELLQSAIDYLNKHKQE
jgi:hypothetical protein